MRIRLAEAADLASIRRVARAAYQRYIPRIGKEPAPMVADFARQIAEGSLRVAVDAEERVCGFVVFYPRGDHLHLENVAVVPELQGEGHGRRLIDFVEAEARATGRSAVELYTNEKMSENIRLYPRLGYQETDRKKEAGFDRVYYRKKLC